MHGLKGTKCLLSGVCTMVRKGATVLVFFSLLFTPCFSFALVPPCTSLAEQQAFKVRALQNELMVAALACNKKSLYNSFMNKFKGDLAARGILIKNYFITNYPKDGTRRLNTFITQLANEASKHSLGNSEDEFCNATHNLFDEVLETNTQGLLNISTLSRYQSITPYLSCTQEAKSEYVKE